MEVCRAYRNNGSCRYGDECKYEHSEGEPITPPPRGECFNWHVYNAIRTMRVFSPRHQTASMISHQQSLSPTVFPRKETGECSFGDRCRFTHGPDDPRYDADGQRIPEEGAGGNKKRKPRKRREPRERTGEKLDEICNNYQTGRCRYGDNCRRQHVGDVPQEAVTKIDEICNNYQAGRCGFGDLCRRQHVDE